MEESRLRKARSFGIGLIAVVGLFLLIGLFLRGMVWASEKALPWLIYGSSVSFYVCVLVLLPLCIFRKTRPWAGVGFYIASYVFGTSLFAFSCIVDVEIWGYGALIFGLILGGVGVLPVAFAATLFHALWSPLLNLVLGTVMTFGTRFLGIYLSTRGEEEEPSSLEV